MSPAVARRSGQPMKVIRGFDIEAKRSRERVEDLRGRMRVPALLESVVVVRADAGQHRKFVAPQARDASSGGGGQPHIFGANLLTARAQVVAQSVGPLCHQLILGCP